MSATARLDSVLSHGTVETKDLDATRDWYENFLGLKVIQPLPMAIYASAGGTWQLVCVKTAVRMKDQARENRFCLHVANEQHVQDAHAAALRDQERYGIRQIGNVETIDGATACVLQDRDNVWWEITARSPRPLHGVAG